MAMTPASQPVLSNGWLWHGGYSGDQYYYGGW